MIGAAPFFSIVVPAHDRAATIVRCIESVRSQRWTDFEIVVVDDGSRDATPRLLRAIDDPRLRILTHRENRGVCPARNTGIDAARGTWVVFLDSDDELDGPLALARMATHAAAAPAGLAALWFRCRLDDGTLSPARLPACRDLDYRGYLAFLEATHDGCRDMIRCVRRACFSTIRYPDSRMLEEKFHLDFARRFRSRLHEDVLRLYHADAADRLVDRLGRLDPRRDRDFILDRARGLVALLASHGAPLARMAPRVFRGQLRRTARQMLLAARALPRPRPAGRAAG